MIEPRAWQISGDGIVPKDDQHSIIFHPKSAEMFRAQKGVTVEALTTVADVLAALRQPSEAMKLTGSLAIQEHYCADGGFCGLRAAQEQMTLTWEAMLDQFERDQGSAT